MRLALGAIMVMSCSSGLAGKPTPPAGGPVVLELFTSQGCSSCPPADRLLSKLGQDPELSGKVITLAYHVDYWNDLGWADPFSSERWTARQRDYNRAMKTGRVYTPQLVVNGGTHLVGSDEAGVRKQIERARPGGVKLTVATRREPGLSVTIAAEAPAGSPELRVILAVVESDVVTRVARGENSGRTLENDFIVRRLDGAFALPAGGRGEKTLAVPLDARWKKVSLVAFAQDPKTLRIHGAALITL